MMGEEAVSVDIVDVCSTVVVVSRQLSAILGNAVVSWVVSRRCEGYIVDGGEIRCRSSDQRFLDRT
jgi:hypothetical protein